MNGANQPDSLHTGYEEWKGRTEDKTLPAAPNACYRLPIDTPWGQLWTSENKNPSFYTGLQYLLISVDKKMVEAGGIEPPSERFQSKVSTCLVSVLNLTQASSQRQDSTRASSDCSHPMRPEHTHQTSPFK